MGSLTNVRIFEGYDGLACDNMITPSLESTSCSSAGILNLFLHPFLSRGTTPLLPLVSAFSGKQPRGSSFDRLVQTCHLLIPSNMLCRCSAPAPVITYIALTQTVSYAAQAQVLEYFAPASSAYAGRLANCNRQFSFSPCRAHRLHLHLWWST